MPNINALFKIVKKSITSLKVIMYTRLVLGSYFNVSKSKIICFFIRLYCISICAVSMTVFHTGQNATLDKLHFIGSLNYVLSTIFSLITAAKYLFKYCGAIKIGDTIMKYKKTSDTINYISAIFYLISSLRLGISVLYLIFYEFPMPFWYSGFIIFASVSLNNMTVLIIFSLLHTRMRMLRNFLERNCFSANTIDSNELSHSNRVRNVRKCLLNYNYLLDNLLCVENLVQWLLIVAFIFNIPANVFYSYHALRAYNKVVDGFAVVLLNAWEAILTVLQVTSPGLIAEFIINEVNDIKKTLTSQLLECSDESLRYELDIFLKFVRWRPFKFMIAGAVPLNGRLPLKMAALCITYVIITAQFKQFL